MPVTESLFRDVLGHLAGGVSLVTSVDGSGQPMGLTATAVCSVSLSPPLVLVSVDRGSHTHDAIVDSGVYGIVLLGERDRELAIRFAGEGEDKFRGLEVRTGETGAPLPPVGLAHLDCVVVRRVPAGDHTVFLGRVEGARIRSEASPHPLLYHLGRYTSLAEPGRSGCGPRGGDSTSSLANGGSGSRARVRRKDASDVQDLAGGEKP